MASAVKTRAKTLCPIFGQGSDFNNRVLPTFYDVMKCCIDVRDKRMPHANSKEATVHEISQIVVHKVEDIWRRASIPIVSTNRAMKILKDYHKKYMNLKKSSHRKQSFQIKIDLFVNEATKKLFDIAACKCVDFTICACQKSHKVPKIEQTFLTDQRTTRKMAISNVDKKMTHTLTRREERKMKSSKSEKQTDKIEAVKETENILVEDCDSKNDKQDTTYQPEKEPMIPTTSSHKEKSQMRTVLSTLARECDRTSISDRSAAKISTAVLTDMGIISKEEKSSVIDRHKIRRERKKLRTSLQKVESVPSLQSVYFDGRKDKTLKNEKIGRKFYKRSIVEEHIVLIREPESKYIGHVSPESGNASNTAKSILEYLNKEFDLSQLAAVGCDGTPTNTGPKGGIIRLMEIHLGRPLQWFVCQLHGNELPLRHLFQNLDGLTSGPKSFSGPIGTLLQTCETLPLVKFSPIKSEFDFFAVNLNDLSSDQGYLLELCRAIVGENWSVDLANKTPGKMAHARWLTTASRILRLYVATVGPSDALVTLATYVVKVYAPVWFTIKQHSSCFDGARNLWKLMNYSRYLDNSYQKIIDPVIQRNAFFAHPESILLGMLKDSRQHIRELAIRRILKVRQTSPKSERVNIRAFKIPELNFNALGYIEIIHWQDTAITEPPILSKISNVTFEEAIKTGDIIDIVRFPCHSQAVERSIKLVTEASTSVCGQNQRDGYIRAKLTSQNLMPKFETKKDYKM